MIAQHREDAVRRGQRRERLGNRRDETAIAPGDVVTAEDHEVRRLGDDHADGVIDDLVRHGVAAVKVRQEPDAKSGQRGRKARDLQCLTGQLDAMTFVDDSRARAPR